MKRWLMPSLISLGVLWQTTPAHAASASAIFGPITLITTAFVGLVYAIGIGIVVLGAVKAVGNLSAGRDHDVGAGVVGILTTLMGATFLFLMIPLATQAGAALAMPVLP